MNSKRYRNWLITVPARLGDCDCPGKEHSCAFTKEMLDEVIKDFGVTYQLERGEKETEKNPDGYLHWQCFYSDSPRTFSSLLKRFQKVSSKGINLRYVKETRNKSLAQKKFEAQNYCRKENTRVAGPFSTDSYKEIKPPQKNASISTFVKKIEDGEKLGDLIMKGEVKSHSQFLFLREVEREIQRKKSFSRPMKPLKVHYWFGKTGVGKSFKIYSEIPRDELFSVSDRENAAFDNYAGQRVILIDEFTDDWFSLSELLKILDPYPQQLSSRFFNKFPAYDEVYLVSNLALDDHYCFEPKERREAFLRRITDYSQVVAGEHDSAGVYLGPKFVSLKKPKL